MTFVQWIPVVWKGLCQTEFWNRTFATQINNSIVEQVFVIIQTKEKMVYPHIFFQQMPYNQISLITWLVIISVYFKFLFHVKLSEAWSIMTVNCISWTCFLIIHLYLRTFAENPCIKEVYNGRVGQVVYLRQQPSFHTLRLWFFNNDSKPQVHKYTNQYLFQPSNLF